MHDFVPLCIGRLENIMSLSNVDLPNVSLYNIKKSHLFLLLPISPEKSLNTGNLLDSQY